MGLILRNVKGEPLTYTEMDDNLLYLESLTGSIASASYALTASYAMNGGGSTPGGLDTQVQFNSGSVLSGSANLSFNYSTSKLQVTGSVISTGGFTGSLQGTASWAQNVQTASLALNSQALNGLDSSSFAITGSNIFKASQVITGSLTITNDLIVLGSSSIQYITSSQLDISDNIISVNAFNPSIRFGGLAVIDSGSSPRVSGSILFDSTNNNWVTVHQGTNTTSSIVITGPETYNDLGNETKLTQYRLAKATSTSGDHIGDSNVSDNGSTVSINSYTEITGSLNQGFNSTASGIFSHAGGYSNKALGNHSHAEGYLSTASGHYSHAEGGSLTNSYKGGLASGEGSHAEGIGTTASGICSHAEGRSTSAVAEGAHAEGLGTAANGVASHAEGYTTDASETYSHAEGYTTVANAVASHAEGRSSTASGNYSHAEGFKSKTIGGTSHAEGGYFIDIVTNLSGGIAYGEGSHAEGGGTVSSGSISHAEGYYAVARGYASHAEGDNTIASGSASHTEGYYTTASGDYSHAEGNKTLTSGLYSHAEGSNTISLGTGSHAEGSGSIASGSYSHAEGFRTTASANYSHAEGNRTKALNIYAHAEGSSTIASGSASHAEGNTTIAYGQGSHAEGFYTTANADYSHAEGGFFTFDLGGGTTYGEGSHAEGIQTIASGSGAHAEGRSTEAKGISSHAEGWRSLSKGNYSHAEGGDGVEYDGGIAHGVGSHAEGAATIASGSISHAEGYGCVSIGYASHAEGFSTIAYADYSHANGLGTIASGSYQNVVGQYNKHNNTTSLFTIGNGADDANRSDIVNVTTTNVQVTGSLNLSDNYNDGTYIYKSSINTSSSISTATIDLKTENISNSTSSSIKIMSGPAEPVIKISNGKGLIWYKSISAELNIFSSPLSIQLGLQSLEGFSKNATYLIKAYGTAFQGDDSMGSTFGGYSCEIFAGFKYDSSTQITQIGTTSITNEVSDFTGLGITVSANSILDDVDITFNAATGYASSSPLYRVDIEIHKCPNFV